MYNNCVHRTQILLENRQYEALKTYARRVDKGLSEIIRLALDRFLGRTRGPGRSRLNDICAIAKDPRGPAGRDHDSLLYGGGS